MATTKTLLNEAAEAMRLYWSTTRAVDVTPEDTTAVVLRVVEKRLRDLTVGTSCKKEVFMLNFAADKVAEGLPPEDGTS